MKNSNERPPIIPSLELVASTSFSEVGKNIAAAREFDFFPKQKPEFVVNLTENPNSSFFSCFFPKKLYLYPEFGFFTPKNSNSGHRRKKKWDEEATNSKLGIKTGNK